MMAVASATQLDTSIWDNSCSRECNQCHQWQCTPSQVVSHLKLKLGYHTTLSLRGLQSRKYASAVYVVWRGRIRRVKSVVAQIFATSIQFQQNEQLQNDIFVYREGCQKVGTPILYQLLYPVLNGDTLFESWACKYKKCFECVFLLIQRDKNSGYTRRDTKRRDTTFLKSWHSSARVCPRRLATRIFYL